MKTSSIQKLIITMIVIVALGTVDYAVAQTTQVGTSDSIQWVCSTVSQPWQIKDAGTLQHKADDFPGTLSLLLDQPAQTIQGWRGCFNELGWKSLQILPGEKRREVLQSLFASDSGLGLTICRMPIGASDYADGWYSLDEVEGDFNLTHSASTGTWAV
jgi:glucosylceramidase